MGAYRFNDLASPYLSALIGSVLTTWMTFAPCFLWIFTFAPYVEFIRGQKIFSDALQAITASVVGVICNLSIWFVLQALFTQSSQISLWYFDFKLPVLDSIDLFATGICLIALVLQFKFNRGLFTILGTCTAIGIMLHLLIN
jgi:chromate transporter